ncbi:pilus assembly protein PilO [Bacillus sp. JJ1533]|uniref:pilus assembly protein PilO n=1 Tax=Bacillus sp. JJ1533 TaxID=3122959 RepID=UPI0030006A44
MTLHFSRKQMIQLILALAVLFGVFYLTFYLLVKPVKLRISQLENSVRTEQKLLELITDKQTNETPTVSSTEIQKKIPVIPLVEQIVLDVQRAETLSKSRVINMSYIESEFTLADDTQPVEQKNATNADNDTENNQETNETDVVDPELINGLNQITVSLHVQSPNYAELEKFLSALEHQTRITRVNSLSFTGTPELISVDQTAEQLDYDVTISTFYMPKYTELADEAPKLTVPPPSNKKNPLAPGLEKKDENSP